LPRYHWWRGVVVIVRGRSKHHAALDASVLEGLVVRRAVA